MSSTTRSATRASGSQWDPDHLNQASAPFPNDCAHCAVAGSIAGSSISLERCHWARRVILVVSYLAVALPNIPIVADEVIKTSDDPKGIEFFEAKIRPILVAHCYQCHASNTKSESGLLLDSRDGVRKGGDRGPAVVPGDPTESLLLTAISHSDSELKMPPKKDRLSESVISDFKRWIKMGAPDPRSTETARTRTSMDLETAKHFWSFQKPVRPAVPMVNDGNWTRRRLDQFILAKLEASGLTPSKDAEPATFLRRMYFDLIGLPPSPAAQAEFLGRVADVGLDAAIEREVDSLLASSQFGEKWGRHWLDVARFAESSGKEANISFPYAWRFRDYVIQSTNDDLPFDMFITEQLAGDLLPAKDDQERARLLIATGFLAVGPKNLDEANEKQFAADLVDEQIDAMTRSILGQSIACARCHDHKLEPYSMHDYYALFGILSSTKTYFGTHVSPANRIAGDPLALPRGAGLPIFHDSIPAERVATLKAELAKLKQEQQAGMAAVLKAVQSGDDPEKYFTLRDALRIFWTSGGIEGQLEKVDDQGKALPLAMGVLDREVIQDAPLMERGEIDRPGKPVHRGFPQLITITGIDQITSRQSGRLELAKWLTHPDHPLTARVFVNRIWRHLFGTGIVATTDNFGLTGSPPSHPELLDELAVQFMSEGWSRKRMIREIVLSRSYRQASNFREDCFRLDPDNRLLWRASKRRMDAEAIRDAMLVASGELDARPPSGSLVARTIGDRPISLIGLDSKIPSDLDGSRNRSVYLPVLRDRLPEVLALFDFAEPSLVTGDRETTNVPLQALYLMNSEFVLSRADAFAGRLIQEADMDARRIQLAYRICFCREPESEETRLGIEFLKQATSASPLKRGTGQQPWAAFCQALLSTAEFRNLD